MPAAPASRTSSPVPTRCPQLRAPPPAPHSFYACAPPLSRSSRAMFLLSPIHCPLAAIHCLFRKLRQRIAEQRLEALRAAVARRRRQRPLRRPALISQVDQGRDHVFFRG